MPEIDDVMASYHRCRASGDFVDTFYKLFLAKSPAIAGKFIDTNFEMQKLMVRQSLLEMLCFDRGISGTEEEILRLGRRHKELEITPDMYTMWLDALCEAIRQHDCKYTPELEEQWRAAMQKSIDAMVSVD